MASFMLDPSSFLRRLVQNLQLMRRNNGHSPLWTEHIQAYLQYAVCYPSEQVNIQYCLFKKQFYKLNISEMALWNILTFLKSSIQNHL